MGQKPALLGSGHSRFYLACGRRDFVSLFLHTLFCLLPIFSMGRKAKIQSLWSNHSSLLVIRLLVGQVAPLILSYMIWRTLLIPHTMAATGLFYIALLGVFVGEILGRQILALTFLPF